MASLILKPQYQLTLTGPEIRLISLALSGRVRFGEEGREGEDATEARALGNTLFTQRALQLKNYSDAHQSNEGTS